MTYKGKELEKIHKTLIKFKSLGASDYECANIARISDQTLSRWLEEGKNKKSRHCKFRLDFKEAESKKAMYHFEKAQNLCTSLDDHLKIYKVLSPKRFVTENKIDAKVETSKRKDVSAKQTTKIIEAIFKKKDIKDKEKEEDGSSK